MTRRNVKLWALHPTLPSASTLRSSNTLATCAAGGGGSGAGGGGGAGSGCAGCAGGGASLPSLHGGLGGGADGGGEEGGWEGKCECEWQHGTQVWRVEWNACGSMLAASADDGVVHIYKHARGAWQRL